MFKGGYKITQEFGNKLIINGKSYYSRFKDRHGFNIKGHNGYDTVPIITGNDVVLSVMNGYVKREFVHKNLGYVVIVYNEELKLEIWYCHLVRFFHRFGTYIKAGEAIGEMGNTGGFEGMKKHVHIMGCELDEHGNRLNTDNGYNGMIDISSFMKSF